MEARAVLKTYRQSPRKVRIVMDGIRGKTVSEARSFLKFVPKRASHALSKLLDSAVANAREKGMTPETLLVSYGVVNEGPTLFRMMPRAQGRATVIRKRTSHISLVLSERAVGEDQEDESSTQVASAPKKSRSEKTRQGSDLSSPVEKKTKKEKAPSAKKA